jgi:FAD/FMN-containing dehydrogenase
MVSCGERAALMTGNLHINIVADKYKEEYEKVIEPYIYEIVGEYSALFLWLHPDPFQPRTTVRSLRSMVWVSSCPAQTSRAADIASGVMKNDTSVEMMRKIKQIFDPKGLLNPYKYIV